MAVIKVDENDPVGELEPSFPFRDVKILHNVDVRDYYDLKEEIGRGKFGTVYRCVEKKTGTVLAAKFVGIAKKQDRINVEREVEIMRTLQHPRLIQLYDSFEIHSVMCVVLELIEGGELFERVIDDDFILTEKACSVFMRQICEGVSFIHANKVIHLDLKPENILCLTKTGNRIKIIDFGLARKYDPDKKLQVLFGTPEFVAPEVVNFDEITYATDMWSVGVICYVLLSGLSPFMGESDLQTMTNVTMAQYDFDDEAFDTISADAKDFISKLLVKNKEKRMTAGDCVDHTWLKRKPPPPPPTFLEQSKENLKTYVETIHTSSPFLLSDSLSNGSINEMITSPPEIPKPKAGLPDKSLQLFELTPERPINVQADIILEEQNLKLKNEINLEKSIQPNIIIHTEPSPSVDENETPTNPDIVFPSTTIKFENKELFPRKLIKTDSFKGLPRKFSLTVSDSSRDLPRRSSLSRTDRGKIELKRENFVTFIGPREIKPIDPLSPDVIIAVEELTNFIKMNIEESTSSKTEKKTQNIDNSTPINRETVDNNLKEITGKSETVKKESTCQTRSKPEAVPTDVVKVTSNSTIVNKKETTESEKSLSFNHRTISSISSNLTSQKSIERVKKKDEIPAFLRPADYIKSVNISTEFSHKAFKSLESKTLGSISIVDKNITGLSDKKSTVDNSVNTLSKELSNLKPSSVPIPVDVKETSNSLTRHQSFAETIYKRQSGKVGFFKASSFDSEVSKVKLNSTENVKTWHSAAIRNDLSLPRKFTHGIKNNESVHNLKESSSLTTGINKTRASSLDPTSAGYSTAGTHEQPFQSRFLRNSQTNSFRCSSETPVSKYEEFKNRYSNYKELASGNDKLFKKSFIERTPTGKSEKTEASAATSRGDSGENISQCSTSKSLFNSQSSSTSSNFLTRQKFKLTEQQRDSYNKFDSLSRLNKTETATSSFKSEKERCYSSVSGIKESLTHKSSHNSTQNSESKSKLVLPEKCPTSPQKSV